MVRQELHPQPLPPQAPQPEERPRVPISTETAEVLSVRLALHEKALQVPAAYGLRSAEEVLTQAGIALPENPDAMTWLRISRGFHIFKERGITDEQAAAESAKPYYTYSEIEAAYPPDSQIPIQYAEITGNLRKHGALKKPSPPPTRIRRTSRGRGY